MKDESGPAFPGALPSQENQSCVSGMTLRDYFAAKVMQGFSADSSWHASPDAIAELAYRWADAMLKARVK
jgi:hypothetical protein